MSTIQRIGDTIIIMIGVGIIVWTLAHTDRAVAMATWIREHRITKRVVRLLRHL